MMEEKTIEKLLSDVTHIRDKYDEIAKITGENFNIFSVLHLESDEVRLHSRFIGELLNPQGSHGQNELFLNLFISTIGLEKQYTTEQLKGAKVIVEENIGGIPDDYSKGGRIDLVIKIPECREEIVIENKIWAGDQQNQLGRYYAEYPNANIIYLTPFERSPCDDSLGEKLKQSQTKVICITYQAQIREWIENCIKGTSNFPLLRETLNQYVHLIKKLTNQSRNNKMEQDILNSIIKDEEKIASALFISDNIEKIKQHVCNKFKETLKSTLTKFECIIDIKEGSEGGANMQFGTSDSFLDIYFNNKSKFKIQFFFAVNYGRFEYGILPEENGVKVNQTQREQVTTQLRFLNSKNWAKDSAYDSWYWFTRDEYFRIDQCINNESINRYYDLITKVINALKDIELK